MQPGAHVPVQEGRQAERVPPVRRPPVPKEAESKRARSRTNTAVAVAELQRAPGWNLLAEYLRNREAGALLQLVNRDPEKETQYFIRAQADIRLIRLLLSPDDLTAAISEYLDQEK